MTLEQQALIKKAISRSNLGRTEQRTIGLLLEDTLKLSEYQSRVIREMKEEIIKLKIQKAEQCCEGGPQWGHSYGCNKLP